MGSDQCCTPAATVRRALSPPPSRVGKISRFRTVFALRPVEAFVVAMSPRRATRLRYDSVFTSTRSKATHEPPWPCTPDRCRDRRLAGGPCSTKSSLSVCKHIVRPEPSGHYDRQTSPGCIHPTPSASSAADRRASDPPRSHTPRRDGGTRVEAGCMSRPSTRAGHAFGLFPGHFQALLSPDPLHPLVVHHPALRPQHPCNHPVPVATEPSWCDPPP